MSQGFVSSEDLQKSVYFRSSYTGSYKLNVTAKVFGNDVIFLQKYVHNISSNLRKFLQGSCKETVVFKQLWWNIEVYSEIMLSLDCSKMFEDPSEIDLQVLGSKPERNRLRFSSDLWRHKNSPVRSQRLCSPPSRKWRQGRRSCSAC